jgi:hypothetical protein
MGTSMKIPFYDRWLSTKNIEDFFQWPRGKTLRDWRNGRFPRPHVAPGPESSWKAYCWTVRSLLAWLANHYKSIDHLTIEKQEQLIAACPLPPHLAEAVEILRAYMEGDEEDNQAEDNDDENS